MRFLFDTNVLIPLEPTSLESAEFQTPHVVELIRLIHESHQRICIHPASRFDLERDQDSARRTLRLTLLRKYPELRDPPEIPKKLIEAFGQADRNSNDYCDDLLLASLHADAVDWLVTEDREIWRKARKIGVADRVLTVNGALQILSDLFEKQVTPPPAVRKTVAHTIQNDDPILRGLREDYPGFDVWLRKAKSESRLTWIIPGPYGGIAGFCIVKQEATVSGSILGKVLKLCTFKVSDESLGFRYGELLLKTVFEYAIENEYDWIYVTVFDKHFELIRLLSDFGFGRTLDSTSLGESIYAKPISIQAEDDRGLPPLEYHVRYGPRRLLVDGDQIYLVPIQPQYSDRLFPETSESDALFHDESPCGTAIRKAYLCHSGVRSIAPGSVLLFYRSQRRNGMIAIGVVERAFTSRDCDEVARNVAKRTVYSLKSIEELCEKDVLAILFRQARILSPPVPAEEAIGAGVMTSPPQSIMRIRKEGVPWVRQLINRLS